MSHLRVYLESLFPLHLYTEADFSPETLSGNGTGPESEKKISGRIKTKIGLDNPENDRKAADGSIKPWTDADLAEHFMKYFGVTVRGTGQHYLFKYYFILQGKRWTHPVTGDCRGTIMMRDMETQHWDVACRPCAKFFNQQETHCPVFKKEEFEKRSEEFVIVEKADGTMISLWWKQNSSTDGDGSWQISTSTVVSVGPEWLEMLQPLFDISNPQVLSKLDKKFTYILELCSKKNKVITKYPDERVYLLVAINAETGQYASIAETDQMALALGLKRPKYFKAKDIGLKTLGSFMEFVEIQSKSPEYPPDPEGFVVYWNEQPLCKLKNKTYSAKHPFHSLGLVAMKMNILERFWEKTTDDVMDVLPQAIKDYLDELGRKVEQEVQNALKAVEALFDGAHESILRIPSEYVKRAREVAASDPWLQSYLMRSREWLVGDLNKLNAAEQAIHDRRSHFVDYLERNWRGKLPFWKETAVPEIVAEEKEFGASGRVLGTTDM